MTTPRRAYRGPDRSTARRVDEPTEGFYRLRLVKAGPLIPARIKVENSTDDDGRVADRPRLVLRFLDQVHERGAILRFWPSLTPVSEAEYRRLGAHGLPLDPRKPVDLSTLPTLF